jgi:hypothetical protein
MDLPCFWRVFGRGFFLDFTQFLGIKKLSNEATYNPKDANILCQTVLSQRRSLCRRRLRGWLGRAIPPSAADLGPSSKRDCRLLQKPGRPWWGSAAYVSALYEASWVLKAMDPIPADYAADERWPAA